MLKPFKRLKAYENIVQQMLDLFRNGSLKPGDRMPSERDLAAEMDVSRATIREAFRSLESMGYTETRVGDGTFVRRFSLDSLVKPMSVQLLQSDRRLIEEFIEVRHTLEVQGVALAARRITNAQIDTLDKILDKMERDIERADNGYEQDREFHITLSRCTGNASLCVVFQACRGMLDKTGYTIMQIPEQPRIALNGHRRILDRLRQRDAKGAAKAMADHLNEIYVFLDRLYS